MNPPTLITSLGDYKEWLLDTLPNQGQWTEDQYLWVTKETNRLVEFSDGFLEPVPMPNRTHQAIMRVLLRMLDNYLSPRSGAVYPAGFKIRVRPGKMRDADITVFKDVDDPRSSEAFCTGADFLVEVVSKDDPSRDYVDKRGEYEAAGVPEYWIVDPYEGTIMVLHLQEGVYVEQAVARRGESVAAATLPGFTVNVDDVFNAR